MTVRGIGARATPSSSSLEGGMGAVLSMTLTVGGSGLAGMPHGLVIEQMHLALPACDVGRFSYRFQSIVVGKPELFITALVWAGGDIKGIARKILQNRKAFDPWALHPVHWEMGACSRLLPKTQSALYAFSIGIRNDNRRPVLLFSSLCLRLSWAHTNISHQSSPPAPVVGVPETKV